MGTCNKLLEEYEGGDADKFLWHGDDARTNGLATQALLFALLFEVGSDFFFERTVT